MVAIGSIFLPRISPFGVWEVIVIAFGRLVRPVSLGRTGLDIGSAPSAAADGFVALKASHAAVSQTLSFLGSTQKERRRDLPCIFNERSFGRNHIPGAYSCLSQFIME